MRGSIALSRASVVNILFIRLFRGYINNMHSACMASLLIKRAVLIAILILRSRYQANICLYTPSGIISICRSCYFYSMIERLDKNYSHCFGIIWHRFFCIINSFHLRKNAKEIIILNGKEIWKQKWSLFYSINSVYIISRFVGIQSFAGFIILLVTNTTELDLWGQTVFRALIIYEKLKKCLNIPSHYSLCWSK